MEERYLNWCEVYSIDKESVNTELDVACNVIKHFYEKEDLSFGNYEEIIEVFFQMLEKISINEFEEKKIYIKNVGYNCKACFLQLISTSLRFAGEKDEIGYAFNGIASIRKNASCIKSPETLIEILEYNSQIKDGNFGNYIRFQNIYELISNSEIEYKDEKELKFRYIDCVILGKKIIRKLYRVVDESYSDYRFIDDETIDKHFFWILENSSKERLYLKVEYAGFCEYFTLTDNSNIDIMDSLFEVGIQLTEPEKNNNQIVIYYSSKSKKIKIDFDMNKYIYEQFDRYDKEIAQLFEIESKTGTFEYVFFYGENFHGLAPQYLPFNNKFKIKVDNEEIYIYENKNEKRIPDNFFGEGITTIQAIIGKNGSGKSSIFELLNKCSSIKNMNEQDEGNFFAIYSIGDKYYYTHNTKYKIVKCTETEISEYSMPADVKICNISNTFDMSRIQGEVEINTSSIIDLTTQSIMKMAFLKKCKDSAEDKNDAKNILNEDQLRIKNYKLSFQNEKYDEGVDKYENIIINDTKQRLSSGEQARLVLFARILSIFHIDDLLGGELKHIDRASNYILLFDEAELYFHPAWQRRLVMDIRDFLIEINQKYNAFDSVCVFFSSNSPFLMSDLPDFCIQKLPQNENASVEMTFGQNIYNLLKSEFFMKDGVMGAFAQRKIDNCLKNISDNLNNDDEKMKKEEIEFISDIIGDPMLREIIIEQIRSQNR